MDAVSAKICVPVTVEYVSHIAPAIKRASEVADLIELRLDYLGEADLQLFIKGLADLISTSPRPLILTLRPIAQGGQSRLDFSQRLEFWSQIVSTSSCFLDLEVDVVEQLLTLGTAGDCSRIICSHHDFANVPSDLAQIYERLVKTGAAIIKIAVAARVATDCLPVFQLLEQARNERRRTIAIAMGDAGIMTRVLGPSRGSFLTYGSLDDQSASAPGQITARALRDIYRIDQINAQTEIFGLIGRPVGHSISPQIHNAAIAAAGLNAVYIPCEVSEVEAFLKRMAHPGSRELDWSLHGLSVTAPHKLAVMDQLDSIDSAASNIGAVNTIVISNEGMHGYNTDAEGFIEPLRERVGGLKNARCAIFGAGGAARAALWALKKEGALVELFVRDENKSRMLAQDAGLTCRALPHADFKGFDIVINTTPLGTRGELESQTPAIARQLRDVGLVYDLVYNPTETRFLSEARSAGCQTVGGIEMLLAQAAAQFKLWTGKPANIEIMREAATRALARETVHQSSTP